MPVLTYCWRCDMDIPMLDEAEWATLAPLMSPDTSDDALKHYGDLTGFPETNINAVWHHRRSEHGPPCSACGKPLRSVRASFCAACGERRERTG